MTAQNSTLTSMKEEALGVLDDLTHMAFSTDTGAEDSSNTTLPSEVIRKAFSETPVKNASAGTYDFEGYLGLTEGNGNTLAKSGLFTASSGGTMRTENLWTATVAKTSSIDLTCGVRVTITVENS